VNYARSGGGRDRGRSDSEQSPGGDWVPMPPISAAIRSVLPAVLAVEQLGQFGGERGEVLALVNARKLVE
jgi:hypothetical protein